MINRICKQLINRYFLFIFLDKLIDTLYLVPVNHIVFLADYDHMISLSVHPVENVGFYLVPAKGIKPDEQPEYTSNDGS